MLSVRLCGLALCCGLTFAPAPLFAEDKPGEKSEAKSDKEKSPADLFAELDKNKDGELTADEVPDEKKKFFEHAVRVGDADKNGKLTAKEFAEGFKPDQPRATDAPRPGQGGQGQFGNPEEMFKRLDTNGDGKLTVAEAPERAKDFIARALEQAGKGKDGEITKEEYVKLARQMRGDGRPGQGGGGEFFARLDANKDGKVTLSEVPEGMKERFKEMLKRAGKGEDGEFTKDEFAKLVPAGGQGGMGGGPPQNSLMRKLDANGDGRISREEISKAAAIFDELDANKDGQLEPRELFAGPGPGREGGANRKPEERRPDRKDGERKKDKE